MATAASSLVRTSKSSSCFFLLLLLHAAAPLYFYCNSSSFFLCDATSVKNPYLADSVWPIAQHDNYAQASTTVEGPLYPGKVDTLFNTVVAGALTVLYTPDGNVVWGSSLTSVFKVDRSTSQLKLIDYMEKDPANRRKDTFRGIYSILTNEGVFYISSGNVISAYGDIDPSDSRSGIEHLGDYEFTDLSDEDERVLALNLSYDGKIVFCTTKGGVGILSRNLQTRFALEYGTVIGESHPKVEVSNSISIDEYGGIYLVTSRYMHRMWWDSVAESLHSLPPVEGVHDEVGSVNLDFACAEVLTRKCEIWSTAYPVDDEPIVGRPTKIGSGTTPSLLKDETTERLYVMIADGKRKQEVMAIDTVTGEIVAAAPVDFSNDQSKESYTEQSILVSGNKLLVSQNALTLPGQRINEFLEAINANEIVEGINAPEFVKNNVFLLPVLLGDSPRGFQQFRLVVDDDYSAHLETTWTRNDIGCPNAIPTMSQSTDVMYCVGKKNTAITEMFMQSMGAGWTIEAVNWQDGETVFKKDVGPNILYNSLYAATQIGADREIIYGSIGGLVRLSADVDSRSSNSPLSNVLGGLSSLLSDGVASTGGIILSAAEQAVRIVGRDGTEASAI